MSTMAVPTDMVASFRPDLQANQRPNDLFDHTKRWCWRNGSAGGEEWHKAVLEAADAAGLTEALVNPAPTLEQVMARSELGDLVGEMCTMSGNYDLGRRRSPFL